jgi:cobalt-zinc-cadmium efflux system outer membrane protein
LEQAVAWALQNNPEIAALRQQHGVAAAGVIIAQTYPFNPLWEGKVRAATGPASAGVTNQVSNEHKLLMEVEVRGQGKFRRRQARMALKRTDWEIANQELALAVRVIRAYHAVLYRREKMVLLGKIIAVNKRAATEVGKRVKLGQLRRADEILIQTELADARAQLALGRNTQTLAWYELRRALGWVDGEFKPQGALQPPAREWNVSELTGVALERRPDLHARQAAVAEADARVRLALADRYGNPTLGPAFEYDPTRVNLIGAQINLPLPVFNTHRGDILQRQAERSRAVLDLRQAETVVRLDVQAAVAHVKQARAWLLTYERQVVPGLVKSVKEMNQMFRAGDRGVDSLRLIDIYRKLLKAIDTELDARWEVAQAQTDLAAAVGEPALAITGVLDESPRACPPPHP